MTEPDSAQLGSALKRHGVSRASLAVEMGVSLQTIHNWCSGRVRVPVERTRELSRMLGARGLPAGEIDALVRAEVTARGIDPAMLRERGRNAGDRAPVMIAVWDMGRSATFGTIARLCRGTLEHMGYSCQVVDCAGEHRLKRQAVRQAVSMGYSGLVLAGITGEAPDPVDDLLSTIQEAANHGLQTVTVQPWSVHLDLPRGAAGIGWDSNVATRLAMELLLDEGHTSVAGLMGTGGGLYGSRQRGMEVALAERGITLDPESLGWPTEDEENDTEVLGILKRSTGVFVPPSQLGSTARVCYENGLRWPDDVSLVTVGHPSVTPRLGRRPFTYVTLPLGKVSRGAAHLMAAMAEGEEYGQEFVLFGASAMPVNNLEQGSVGRIAVKARA